MIGCHGDFELGDGRDKSWAKWSLTKETDLMNWKRRCLDIFVVAECPVYLVSHIMAGGLALSCFPIVMGWPCPVSIFYSSDLKYAC